jgi:murein DD-endopeptidase MepM/ murein hydrolase activator NlpD
MRGYRQGWQRRIFRTDPTPTPLSTSIVPEPLRNRPLPLLALLLAVGVGVVFGAWKPAVLPAEPATLPTAHAVGVRLDTLMLGGYASGSFGEAIRVLASDLSAAERAMVAQHLEKVFGNRVEEGGLGGAGRLRVAYERARRPDGSTRSVRVLAAEAAVAGRLHTAFYFERDGEPGYFDQFGRPLDTDGWTSPLRGARVSSPFGMQRMHPILNRVLPHTGVDYAAPTGTPVHVTGDGVVIAAGRRGGYGIMVEVQHPSGYTTRYAHLSRLGAGVAEGGAVRQGEVIGHVGATGLATGPHLHYELRSHGRPLDPLRGAGGPGTARDVAGAPEWPREQGRLTGLLARTPSLVQSYRPGGR